jgi:7-keto-8-aminopelargonate synthetase-like enzyme
MRQFLGLDGFTDHTPHSATHSKVDMRHTFGKAMGHVGGTIPASGDHVTIGSP